jgi:hypothetical protein
MVATWARRWGRGKDKKEKKEDYQSNLRTAHRDSGKADE